MQSDKGDNIQSTANDYAKVLPDITNLLENYDAMIPSNIMGPLLETAGLSTSDPKIAHLISLAGEKFIADIVNDAYQYKATKGFPKHSKDKCVLSLDELSNVCKERGISVKKPVLYH